MTLTPEAREVLDTILTMLVIRRADLVAISHLALPSAYDWRLEEIEYNILSIAE